MTSMNIHGPGVEVLEQPQRFPHGQKLLERRDLELDARFLAEPRADRRALVKRLAGIGPQDALDDLDERGFARAVRAKEAEADALFDGQTHAVHGAYAGVGLDHVLYFDNGGHVVIS